MKIQFISMAIGLIVFFVIFSVGQSVLQNVGFSGQNQLFSLWPLLVFVGMVFFVVINFSGFGSVFGMYSDYEEEDEEETEEEPKAKSITIKKTTTVDYDKEKKETERQIQNDYLSELPKTSDSSKERKKARDEWSNM